MDLGETVLQLEFANSRQRSEVSLHSLYRKTVDFLEHFSGPHLVGTGFHGVVGDGGGEARFARMIAAAGHRGDPFGFFTDLTRRLAMVNGGKGAPVSVNDVEIPSMLAVRLLELMMPGDGFVCVKDVAQLETLTNSVVPEHERDSLRQVMDTYPVRLSMHALRQMRVSEAVGYQYAPFVQELDPAGEVNTWVGRFHEGLIERMYANRVIFLLNMSCPVYCRFCFRKHKDLRNHPDPTPGDVLRAVGYVREDPRVREILITGGDPFLARKNMTTAIEGLTGVPHVRTMRLATRSVSYYPHMFRDNDGFWLKYLSRKNIEAGLQGKRIEVATHFIHPDEVSIESLEIISELVSNGIPVYVQTPFLNNCNDRGPELVRLFRLLRGAGAELHYIFIPCSPIKGNGIYRTAISRGLDAACHLRAHLSDRAMPGICTATATGKIDWFSSGWAVEKDASDRNFIWIRTPYTPAFFRNFEGKADEPDVVRLNPEGTLDVRFMAGIEDETCFLGNRPATTPRADRTDEDALARLQRDAARNQRIGCGVVPAGPLKLFRPHETRVELDAAAGEPEINYIRSDGRVTDVLISAEADAVEHLHDAAVLVEKLRGIRHVNAVRLRSVKFNYSPGIYTGAVISTLGRLNNLSVSGPLRLEIETQFLHPGEITTAHGKLAARLRGNGITVYGNLPLLRGVNATAGQVERTAHGLRAIGIEFHHVYVAGLPIQRAWSAVNPMDVSDITDIASRVRMEGSGREIPRYIILTELGEVDFGLTSRLMRKNGGLAALLLPYSLEYYRAMDARFNWPPHVQADSTGRPIVPVPGLTASNDFLVYPPPGP